MAEAHERMTKNTNKTTDNTSNEDAAETLCQIHNESVPNNQKMTRLDLMRTNSPACKCKKHDIPKHLDIPAPEIMQCSPIEVWNIFNNKDVITIE